MVSYLFCSYVASNLQVVVVSFLFPTVIPLKETTGFPKYTPKLETKVVYIGGGGVSARKTVLVTVNSFYKRLL